MVYRDAREADLSRIASELEVLKAQVAKLQAKQRRAEVVASFITLPLLLSGGAVSATVLIVAAGGGSAIWCVVVGIGTLLFCGVMKLVCDC